MRVQRFTSNPIVTPGMDPNIGTNINGPSLIQAPDWLPDRLGKYYLYFAHHQGQYIRLAYADDLHGPWTVYGPGTLQLKDTACGNHIASPDAHVDNDRRKIVMYFHGKTRLGQMSFIAESDDGIHFKASTTALGPSYFRVFEHEGGRYALARAPGKEDGALLLRASDEGGAFEQGPALLPRCRHAAVLKRGDKLLVFFSRGYDTPERLLLSMIELQGDWHDWKASEPVTVLAPEEEYEGADLPLEKSDFGKILQPARQLRDPAVFEEEGRLYLLYSVAGESGIGIAEMFPPEGL